MHSSLDRSLLWFWALFLCAGQAWGGDTILEIQTVRAPAVIENDRAFLGGDSSEDLLRAFADGARPLSLAAGDFDGDGMPDLAAGFAVENGSFGLVALWRGNIDSLFSWSPEARQRRGEGGFTETPFFGPPAVFAVPEPPELLATGRFDRDAHLDLLAAAGNGGTVYLLDGNGRGGLGEATAANLAALPLAWAAAGSDPAAKPEADPVATLELRLNSDAFPDLVLLESGSATPVVLLTVFDCSHTVDSVGDEEDFDLGDDLCDTNDSTGDGPCTLRAAIQEGCPGGGLNKEIRFDIPGSFQRVIAVGSELPTASETTIDGSTQPQIIALDGGGGFVGDGLGLGLRSVAREIYVGGFGGSGIRIYAGNTVVEGCHVGKTSDLPIVSGGNLQGIDVDFGGGTLIGGAAAAARNVITGNGNFGISFTNPIASTSGTVEGNYIGTNGSGDGVPVSSSQPCGIEIFETGSVNVVVRNNLISGNDIGICASDLDSSGMLEVVGNKIGTNADGTGGIPNRIGIDVSRLELPQTMNVGGATAADRNLISGNTESGLELAGPLDGLLVQGNYIGTDMAGSTALANGLGVDLSGTSGPEIHDNVISGNTTHGLYLHGNSGTILGGNSIGTDAAGTGALGNGSHGVWVTDASSDVAIAGDYSGGENRVAHNGAAGIAVGGGSTGVDIIDNRIFANSRLGIDLVDALFLWDGVTPNDPLGDPDNGPNNLQNHPTITAVTATSAAGTLSSTPSTGFNIEIYTSAGCDPSGHGEAETYYGTALMTTNADGDGAWDQAAGAVPAGHYVTAIAWNPATGDTSEFSMCRRDDATCPYPPHLALSNGPVAGAQSFTACNSIATEGDFGVALFSSVVLTAGESVAFGSGFKVLGDLTVEIDSALAVP